MWAGIFFKPRLILSLKTTYKYVHIKVFFYLSVLIKRVLVNLYSQHREKATLTGLKLHDTLHTLGLSHANQGELR